jgi:hypothetical protein
MITVSYKLAQKMKKLGWEQKTEFKWYKTLLSEVALRFEPYESDLKMLCFAPTADEIVKAIPNETEVEVDRLATGVWQAFAFKDRKYIIQSVEGTTIAEALGELWCKIQEGI